MNIDVKEVMEKSTPAKDNTNEERYLPVHLHFEVFRALPLSVLVLNSNQVAVFANRAATRLLGRQCGRIENDDQDLGGKGLIELGVMSWNKSWGDVLVEFGQNYSNMASGNDNGGKDGQIVQDIKVAFQDPAENSGQRLFQTLLSGLSDAGQMYYVLTFIQEYTSEKGSSALKEDPIARSDSGVSLPQGQKPFLRHKPSRSVEVAKLKKAVFESCKSSAFIISKDEKIYLANRAKRDLVGDLLGAKDGCDAEVFWNNGAVKLWNQDFSRMLEQAEYPGVKLVRSETAFSTYPYGLTMGPTEKQFVMTVKGECLYDDDSNEFLGGICWGSEMQEYADFVHEQLQKKINSHETICNVMPHMVWTTSADGLCDWFSNRWYDFTGLSEAESIGTGYKKAIHPEDITLVDQVWSSHYIDGTEWQIEIRNRRHDGVYKWMLLRACPLRNSQTGELLKWYGTNTDIHDLVMARIRDNRKKEQFLAVLAHAEVNLFAIDRDRKITMTEGGMIWHTPNGPLDPARQELFIGKDAIDIAKEVQNGGVPIYEQNILDILGGKVGVATSEDRIGDQWYRTRCVADLEHDIHDGGQKPIVRGVIGLSIDVTDVKKRVDLEVDNTRLTIEEKAAKDSNRIKSQFLANMSHEMRTPTAGVIGMISLLSEDPTLTPSQREYVSSIDLSAKALLTIVNDVLDFSKIESGRLDIEEVPFSLSNIVSELCKLLAMFAHQKGLHFIYEYEMDEDIEVLGDPGRIRQILSNLLTNALKFTKEGMVKLRVTASLVEGGAEGKEVFDVKFVIEDSGIGIEQQVLNKLFQPFSQGDSSTARLYGGTGLGLTICRNLASLMSGSITLTSKPNIGSTATFTAPLKISPNSQSSSPTRTRNTSISSPSNLEFRDHANSLCKIPSWTQPLAHRSINQDLLNQAISSSVTTSFTSNPSFSREGSSDVMPYGIKVLNEQEKREIHVLVVEDNPINQTIATRNLKNLGFPCTAVWNGREALSYLLNPGENQPVPDIIFMDVQMPVMDGYEATKILRTDKEYSIAVPDTKSVRHGVRVGVKDHLRKAVGKMKEVEGTKMRLRDIPVIAMTASAIQGDKEKCTNAGMDDYLAKPVEKEKLEEMIIKWAGRRRES